MVDVLEISIRLRGITGKDMDVGGGATLCNGLRPDEGREVDGRCPDMGAVTGLERSVRLHRPPGKDVEL